MEKVIMEKEDRGEAPGLEHSNSDVSKGSLVPFDEGSNDDVPEEAKTSPNEKEVTDLSDKKIANESQDGTRDQAGEKKDDVLSVNKDDDESSEDCVEESTKADDYKDDAERTSNEDNKEEAVDDTMSGGDKDDTGITTDGEIEADDEGEVAEASKIVTDAEGLKACTKKTEENERTTADKELDSSDGDAQTSDEDSETPDKDDQNHKEDSDTTDIDTPNDSSSDDNETAGDAENQHQVEENTETAQKVEDATGSQADITSDDVENQIQAKNTDSVDDAGVETVTATEKGKESQPEDKVATEQSDGKNVSSEVDEKRARSIAAFQEDLARTDLSRSTLIKRHPEEFIRFWRDECTSEQTLVFFSHIPYYMMNLAKCDQEALEGAPKKKLYTALSIVPKETVEMNIMDNGGGVEIHNEVFEVNQGERIVIIARNEKLAKVVRDVANKRVKSRLQELISAYKEQIAQKKQLKSSNGADEGTEAQKESDEKVQEEPKTEEKVEDQDGGESHDSNHEPVQEVDTPAEKSENTDVSEAENKPNDTEETEVKEENVEDIVDTSDAITERALVTKDSESSAFNYLVCGKEDGLVCGKEDVVNTSDAITERALVTKDSEKSAFNYLVCGKDDVVNTSDAITERALVTKDTEKSAFNYLACGFNTFFGTSTMQEESLEEIFDAAQKEKICEAGELQNPAEADSQKEEVSAEERDTESGTSDVRDDRKNETDTGGRDECEENDTNATREQEEEVEEEKVEPHDVGEESETISVVEKKPSMNQTEELSPELSV